MMKLVIEGNSFIISIVGEISESLQYGYIEYNDVKTLLEVIRQNKKDRKKNEGRT